MLFCTQPRALETPLSLLSPPGVPPHALLCTMVHGLASSPLEIHEDPNLTNCRDSEALFPLHPEPWQQSPSAVPAVPFMSPAPRPLSVLFTRVWTPPLTSLDSASSLFCPRFNQSPLLLARTVRTSPLPFPHPGSPLPSIAVCVENPMFPLISPSPPPFFPVTPSAPWRGGLSAAMYQRHPRGLDRGSALVNLRPGQDLGLLAVASAHSLGILSLHRGS